MIDVREAVAGDYAHYARLFPELGTTDPLPGRARFEEDLATRMLLATAGGDPVGYVLLEMLDGIGYVRNLVCTAQRRRSGVGTALLDAARTRFRAAGATAWCLNVLATNAAAIALYERFGLRAAYRTVVARLAHTVALPAPDGFALVAPPAETDGTLEPRFKLIPGQLASARRRGRDLVQLVRGDEVVGVGVFSAAIPGAFPFRATSPDVAAPFLALLRARAGDRPFVQVGVEDDAPLADAVLALGAHVHHDLVHMTGSLTV